MKNKCKNHLEKDSTSFCHSCSANFCRECLVEGSEYYYCKSEVCQEQMQKEILSYSKVEKVKAEKKKNNLLYEYKQSKFPFFMVSLVIAFIISAKLGDFNNEAPEYIGLFLGRVVGLWGIPFLLTFLFGFVITIKSIRAKLFYYIYFVSWGIIIFLSLLGSF